MTEPTLDEILELGRILDEANVPTKDRMVRYLDEDGNLAERHLDDI